MGRLLGPADSSPPPVADLRLNQFSLGTSGVGTQTLREKSSGFNYKKYDFEQLLEIRTYQIKRRYTRETETPGGITSP